MKKIISLFILAVFLVSIKCSVVLAQAEAEEGCKTENIGTDHGLCAAPYRCKKVVYGQLLDGNCLNTYISQAGGITDHVCECKVDVPKPCSDVCVNGYFADYADPDVSPGICRGGTVYTPLTSEFAPFGHCCCPVASPPSMIDGDKWEDQTQLSRPIDRK